MYNHGIRNIFDAVILRIMKSLRPLFLAEIETFSVEPVFALVIVQNGDIDKNKISSPCTACARFSGRRELKFISNIESSLRYNMFTETIGAFDTGGDTVNLHRPSLSAHRKQVFSASALCFERRYIRCRASHVCVAEHLRF
jgi:hypothetical protein